jgi:hypothetical protein
MLSDGLDANIMTMEESTRLEFSDGRQQVTSVAEVGSRCGRSTSTMHLPIFSSCFGSLLLQPLRQEEWKRTSCCHGNVYWRSLFAQAERRTFRLAERSLTTRHRVPLAAK